LPLRSLTTPDGTADLALAQADGPLRATTPAERSARWGDLRTRLLSAAVMVPVALGCIWIGGAAFAALVALISIGMAIEWLRMCQVGFGPRPVLMFACLPLVLFLTAVGAAASGVGLLVMITGVASVCLGGFGPARPLAFGIPYIGTGAVALIWLRSTDHGRADVIALLLVIWATDIGAYMVGRAVGGPRLAPRISPGKTWSGAVGGLLTGMAAGFIIAVVLGNADTSWRAALLASLIAGGVACIGQAGDLFESLLKRHFDVKDSGSLIPGHGGLIDRLDAVLAAAPVAALLALVLGRGVIP